MRSALFVASALAIGALAGPIEKRKVFTEYDVDVTTVIVYVTPGAAVPTPAAQNYGGHNHQHHYSKKPVPAPVPSSSLVPPPPAYTPVPPPPPPPPASTPAPAPAPPSTPPPSKPSSSPAPASSAPSSGYGTHKSGEIQSTFTSGQDYIDMILYHHNVIRANHGAGELTWDESCAAAAQKTASECNFKHSVPDGQGQNLFTVSGDCFNVSAGVHESWYKSELPHMDGLWGQNSIQGDAFEQVGHLTQMVWKGTTKVGCASVDCTGKMIMGSDGNSPMNKFTVCNYAAAGNVMGKFNEFIQPPTDPNNLGSWLD